MNLGLKILWDEAYGFVLLAKRKFSVVWCKITVLSKSKSNLYFNVLDLTELSIEGDNKTNLEVLVKKVGYSNSREFPTPGRRNLHLSTVVMWVWNLISSFRVHLLNDGCLKRTEQYNFQISVTITLWSTICSYVVSDTWFKLNLCQCELMNVCTVFCWIYNYYALDFLAVARLKSVCFKLSKYLYMMLSVMKYLSHLSEF